MSDRVDECVAQFGEILARQAAERFENEFVDLTVGSPIEQLMAAALLFAIKSVEHFATEGRENRMFPKMPFGTFETLNHEFCRHGITIHSELPIGKYRADFFVDFKSWRGTTAFAVIECDGHDFHERTKAQAEHDKARDRYLQSLGVLVLRYTGAEIHRDPLAAAVQALTIIENRTEMLARQASA